jgi:hypothetical protein
MLLQQAMSYRRRQYRSSKRREQEDDEFIEGASILLERALKAIFFVIGKIFAGFGWLIRLAIQNRNRNKPPPSPHLRQQARGSVPDARTIGPWKPLFPPQGPTSAPNRSGRDPLPPLREALEQRISNPSVATSSAEPLPFRRQPHLLTKGERALWYPLFKAVKGKYRVAFKVRLADICCCPRDLRNEDKWFRKIRSFHVDFVICEPRTTAPLLVVELDDRTHRSQRQRERDGFKDAVLKSAGIPVLRITAQQAYSPDSLRAEISRMIPTRS